MTTRSASLKTTGVSADERCSHSLLGAACTTMIVTRGASADGSVMVSHSDDNHLADQSIVFVPARDWPKGSLRPVYASALANSELPQCNAFFVPRLADAQRAPGYAHAGAPRSIPLGHIPQARHTYAYLDGSYGLMNEHGLMFGQCTDGSFVSSDPEPGRPMFHSSELTRVALERCRTAREAIRLMGELIETYGYYGTGETLPMADNDEAWVMETAPSPEGNGGLWVAQRVPDGHFSVTANEFRIREIIPGNPDQICCNSLMEVIDRAGWRNLFEMPVAKYSQGMLNTPEKTAQNVGYAQEWLDKADYAHGPARSHAKTNT